MIFVSSAKIGICLMLCAMLQIEVVCGGEWLKTISLKIVIEFHRSRSLIFLVTMSILYSFSARLSWGPDISVCSYYDV